ETRCDIRDSCDCLLDADADTKCMDNPCNSYVPGTCDSTSDCGCLNGYSCSGDCVDCDYDSWENVGGCGDPCLVDEVLQKRESTNECTPQTRCNSDAICTGV
ncbi:MAG: hypothetical protein QF798_01285, partial [Candidatus Woesearchaeota archaeon]|nr:hypothetical protein [Candidatus Woesearchaeota archaeon]